MTRCLHLVAALLTIAIAAPAMAQDKKDIKKDDKKDVKKDDKKEVKKAPPAVFTNPADAGPDFLIQGEYEGMIGGGKVGVQVVALGEGGFDVYLLGGGLPGAGWDKKTRSKSPALTKDSKVTFASKDWSGAIGGGLVTGKTEKGDAFTLKRVERTSPTLGAKAPPGALILFDGSSAAEWKGGKIVEDNLLYCGVNSVKPFAAGKLHIEFRTPFQPKARGQGRGNSGVYYLGREVQVLDSFGLNGENNECGGYYGSAKPAVNMCFPPLSWQTYDLEVKEDKEGVFLSTVYHNGVKIHEDFVIKASSKGATINLQNHGNPVVYRNIWFVPAK